MERKVWKYILNPLKDESQEFVVDDAPEGKVGLGSFDTEVVMPVGAQLLTIAASLSGIAAYALVDASEDAETEVRSFFVCGNDIELPEGATADSYVGTYKVTGGITIHVFETSKVAA